MTRIQHQNPVFNNIKSSSANINDTSQPHITSKYNSYDIFQPSKIRIFFGKSIEVAELNDKTDNKMPSDDKYRDEIAIASKIPGCTGETLAPIVGPNEFMDLIKEFNKEENHKAYSTGEIKSSNFKDRLAGVISGEFGVSLHNHTDNTHGQLSTEALLDQAVLYADMVAKIREENGIKSNLPCFVLGITDHDNLKSAQDAVKLVAADKSGKYKNLKIVLGLEQTAVIKTNFLRKPITNPEILCYCLNPFDKEIELFTEVVKNKRLSLGEKRLKKLNSKLGTNFDLDEIRNHKNVDGLLKNVRGSGFFHYLKQYLRKKVDKTQHEDVRNIMGAYTPQVEDVVTVLRKNKGEVLALAHPGRIDFEDEDLITDNISAPVGDDKAEQAMYMLLKRLKHLGVTACETHYQYTNDDYEIKRDAWLENINNCAKDLKLDETGGQDGHIGIFSYKPFNLKRENQEYTWGRDKHVKAFLNDPNRVIQMLSPEGNS